LALVALDPCPKDLYLFLPIPFLLHGFFVFLSFIHPIVLIFYFFLLDL